MPKISSYDIHRLALISDTEQQQAKENNFYQVSALKPQEGEGFIDIAHFPKVQIVRSIVHLKSEKKLQRNIPLHFFGVNLFLNGQQTITFPDLKQRYEIKSPSLLLRKGYLGNVEVELPAKVPLAMLSLDINNDLSDYLDPETIDSYLLQFNKGSEQTKLIEGISEEMYQNLHQLLHIPQCQNHIDLLNLESKSLKLLSQLLHEYRDQSHVSRLTKQAQQILQNDLSQKITISQLARRIGTNECDLKRIFKQESGYTVNEYRTLQKMERALQLLKSRYRLIQIADYLGYSSVYYFVEVFKKHFGYPPIEQNY